MLTLLKREIQDNIAFFIAAALFSAVLILTTVSVTYSEDPGHVSVSSLSLMIPTVAFTLLGFYAMGSGQMRFDKSRKISALLVTLPVSRHQILIARIITGLLAILLLLVPPAVTAQILIRLHPWPYPIYPNFVAEIFTGVLLASLACYCLGLQIGYRSSIGVSMLACPGRNSCPPL
jgi:ABC-type transport system involved in multi-copper enzyme maturation permease subunit